MKTPRLIIILLALFAFSSCMSTEEHIVVNEDNSGSYTYVVDIWKVIEMLNGMGSQMGGQNKDIAAAKVDSLFNLDELVAASTNLTAAEKELYKNASIRIRGGKEAEELKIIMYCPFRSIDQLAEIKDSFLLVVNKIKAFDKILDKDKDMVSKMTQEQDPEKSLTPTANYYKFAATIGSIETKLSNPQKVKDAFAADSSLIAMQEMMDMMGEPTYKTIITTAKQIKSYTGNGAILSPDKRTVTFTHTFSEMMENPERLCYKIEY